MESKKGKTGQSRGFSLYDLTSDGFQHELLEKALALAEEGGLDQETAMEAALASVENLTKDKVCAYAVRIKQWNAEAEALKNEETRLGKRRKARENMVEKLEKRLVELLPHDGVYEDTRAKVAFRNYEKVEVDMATLPEEYKVPPKEAESTADLQTLKRTLKAGNAVPGAKLVDNWKVKIK